MNDIRKVINEMAFDKRLYIYYKFPELRSKNVGHQSTEEELLQSTGRKTMDGFKTWEKTPEYNMFLALYLEQKAIKDIYDVYEVVKADALKGDDKSVKLLLSLNKEIKSIVNSNKESLLKESKELEEEEFDDGLVI